MKAVLPYSEAPTFLGVERRPANDLHDRFGLALGGLRYHLVGLDMQRNPITQKRLDRSFRSPNWIRGRQRHQQVQPLICLLPRILGTKLGNDPQQL